MPELTALQGRTETINIVRRIGVQWAMVGTTLLDDKDGTIIPAIAQQHGNNADRINMDILGRWIRGEGIPDHSWRGLLGALRVHCGEALAQSVQEVLTEQGKSYSHSCLTGRTSLFFRAYNWPGQLPPITIVYTITIYPPTFMLGWQERGGGGQKNGSDQFSTREAPTF